MDTVLNDAKSLGMKVIRVNFMVISLIRIIIIRY